MGVGEAGFCCLWYITGGPPPFIAGAIKGALKRGVPPVIGKGKKLTPSLVSSHMRIPHRQYHYETAYLSHHQKNINQLSS